MARRSSLLVSKTLYQIGIVTLFVALTWVGIGVYLALNKQANAEVDTKILEPINPVIDQEVIKALSSRLVVEIVEPTDSSAAATPTPSDSIQEDSVQEDSVQ
jgi:hypothetical protein